MPSTADAPKVAVLPTPGLSRRRRRLPWVAGAVAIAAALTLGLLPGAAVADPADRAQARADAVKARLEQLQPQLDAAMADYEATLGGLAQAVTRSVGDDRSAQDAELAAQAAQRQQDGRIRAMYMDGGELSIVNGFLSAEDTADITAQWVMTQSVVDFGAAQERALTADSVAARGLAHSSKLATRRVIVTVADVQDRYQRLAALFRQQRQLFASLDAKAKSLLAQQQQALATARQAAADAAAHAAATPSVLGIPSAYLALYRAGATTCPGLNWTVLAAIGQVESGHGRSVGPSSAGAEGPMQFMPSTFDAYAVDGDGNGSTNIWDPADSIFTAAHYLCANGAGNGPQGLYTAIWHYNHADWYVQMVLNLATEIATKFGVPAPAGVKG
jgi:hypothetical protein